MAWTRKDGVIDDTLGQDWPLQTASTSTVVIEDEDTLADGFAVGEPPAKARALPEQQTKRGPLVPEQTAVAPMPGIVPVGPEGVATPEPYGPRLRMFGVAYEQFVQDAVTEEELDTGIVEDHAPGTGAPDAFSERYRVAYIESNAEGNFHLQEGARLRYTWVPTARLMSSDLEVIDSYNPVGLRIEVDVPIVVLYKDPFVFKLPDMAGGGWLMLLARVRTRVSDLEPGTEEQLIQRARDMEVANGGRQVWDIVAWHCTSQTFRSGKLKGPFLVVDSMNGVLPAGVLSYRTRLGAPTAVVFERWEDLRVLVYYNINRAYDWDHTNGTPTASFDGGDLAAAKNAYDNTPFSTGDNRFRSGVGVQSLGWFDIRYALDHWVASTEEPHNRADSWPGEINEPVRYFVRGRRGEYQTMGEAVEEAVTAARSADSTVFIPPGGEAHPRASDPAAFLEDGHAVHFVTISPTDTAEDGDGSGEEIFELSLTENTMLGIWRFDILEYEPS